MKETTRRRLKTVPGLYIAFGLIIVLFPVLVAAAAITDLARKLLSGTPMVATRLVLFGLVYLTFEALGVVALGASWLITIRDEGARLEQAYAIQNWWASGIFSAARRLFSLGLVAKGHDTAPTPMVLIARHASIIDNLLPAVLLTRPRSTRIRYVMKRELLLDPCLDIAGNRLPNHFVDRSAGTADTELMALARLAEGLAGNEGLLIYPEGTRFSPEKKKRIQERQQRLKRSENETRTMRRVLPPKSAGVQAILDSTDAPVVVMTHRGLESFATIRDIWRGAMVGSTIEVEFWICRRPEIPRDHTAQREWLFDLWHRIDDWLSGDAAVTSP